MTTLSCRIVDADQHSMPQLAAALDGQAAPRPSS
jgi:hypothetical protein